MAISITATPSVLVEEEGTLVTLTLNSSEPIPEGGLVLTVSSETVNALGQLDVLATQSENVQILGVNDNTSGFRVRLNEQTGTITLPVFDDSDEDSPLDLTFSVEPGEGYTVDESAGSVTLTIEDAEGGMATDEGTDGGTDEATDGTGLPLVSLNTGPDYLVEADGTVSAHVFNVTEETIPEDGIVVGVNAPNLGEFDLDAISVGNDGEIVNVREDGFDIRLKDFTTLVNLPVAADGETEGLETASFSLEAGDGYEVNDDFSSGSFSITDTADEVPANTSEPNDIIPLANDIELSPDNSQVTVSSSIDFKIGNRYPNENGSFTYVDATEDVDFYEVSLNAGDIVSFDIDSQVKGNPAILDFDSVSDDINGILSTLQVFDAKGNVLAAKDLGQAPGELFAAGSDTYIEFEAPSNGDYYLGVSVFENGEQFRFALPAEFQEDAQYDPFAPASGSGNYIAPDTLTFGDYDLTFTLNPDNPVILAEQLDRSNNTPPETIDAAEPGEPSVSLNFVAATYASFTEANLNEELEEDEILSGNLVEGLPFQGSNLTLVVETEGEIPEEGILVTINSDSYLRDYFTVGSFLQPPFSPGSELADVVTDDTGRETGLQLRIFEPVTFLPFGARNQFRGELLEPETDDPEDVTYFLENGEGYGIDPDASQFTTTFYDNQEQAPEPSVIPEVGLTISETELIESSGTETTLNFSLSEAPPPEGVIISVKGANEGILPQFDIFNTEASGGVFPIPNFDLSGFFFKVTEQEASVTISAFEDPFEEGLQSFNFALQEAPLYTIDSDASEVNFTIADTPDSVLEVSLSSESVAVESDNTPGILTFNLTAFPAVEGVEVTVNTPNLSEFDSDAFTVTGGEITEITDTGFSLNITDITATVELSARTDGEAEGLETTTFSLVDSPEYLTDPEATEAIITLVDVPEQIPITSEIDANDTIAQADSLNLNPENPNVSLRGELYTLDPNEGSFPFRINDRVDFTEDVDFYSFNLEAGNTVKIDVDSIPFEVVRFEGVEQRLDSQLRLFDAEGNELASVNNAAAPDEEFSRDPYLEFTAQEAGSYYVGVSQLGNNNYDPNVESSGSGWIFPEIGVFAGEYDLNVSLTPNNVSEEPTTEPVFGSLEGDIIEVSGTSQLIFGGDSDDLIDASISSTGNNRIYAGSGDDTLILGNGDRLVGGDGADKFFALSGGDNILTGGAGADQFWIATAETPDAANIITDFTSGEDVLGIAGLGIGFDDLSISQQEDNTLIAANNSELAILQGIATDSLIADNFAFV